MSVAMALAEATHHSAPRRQRTARAREEGREQFLLPSQSSSTSLRTSAGSGPTRCWSRRDVLAARPTPLVHVRPQAGVQRHAAVHIVDILPYMQILDVPVPQRGEELVEFMQKLDTVTPEQVVEASMLSHDSIPQRSALRRPQKAEQLVEVPTVLSFALLQQHVAEQIIDIPVPGRGGGGGGRGGAQGLSSGQNSTARLVEQNVDTQVPRRRRIQGGFPGSHPGQGSTAGVPEQIDDIRSLGGLQGFLPRQGTLQRNVEQLSEILVHAGGGRHLPDPGASGSSAVSRDGSGLWDFRSFSHDDRSARSAGSSSARLHQQSSSWTQAACEAEEAAFPGIENEFFDYGGLSRVTRWISSWAGFVYWLIDPERGWYGAFTQVQWDFLRRSG